MNVKLNNLKSSALSLWSVVCPLSPVLCRLISTPVERALQIHPFLTNKANFQKSQMNVSNDITMEYEQMDTWSHGKNKAKTKPIQTQTKPIITIPNSQIYPMYHQQTTNNEQRTNNKQTQLVVSLLVLSVVEWAEPISKQNIV
jgi:hypothetical protein